MDNSILKKIWRDLVERKGRSALTIVGLCIGFWAVGSAGVAWLVLSNDLAQNFTQTNPPSIAMTIDGPGIIDVGRIGAVEGAADIENRPRLTGRVQYAPDRWMSLILWVVEDFTDLRVGIMFPEDATLPPPTGSVVIERDGLPIANFLKRREQSGSIGHGRPAIDPGGPFVRFEDAPVPTQLAGGIDVMADISGTVFDPRQAPSRMEMAIYAYATRDTVEQWGAGISDRLLVTPAEGYGDEAAIRDTAARLEARLNTLGYDVEKTDYPSHTEHVHQFQMNSILWLISGVGALALLVSVVLVVNLINGILTNQVRQIGVLKAIGASARQVTLMYAGAMWVIGVAAALLSLPFAIKSGFVVSRWLAALLNFDLLTQTLPVTARLGFVVCASMFPVLAALPAVRHWSNVAVTDALQHFGANPKHENTLRIESMAALFALDFRMGLRNAFRKPQRTLMTAATLGRGALVFMIAMNTRTSLLYTAETEERARRYDVLVGFEEPIDASRVWWMDAFPIVERAETWSIERTGIVSLDATQDETFRLFRVPDDSDMMEPNVLSGHWLDDDRIGGIVINHRLQQAYPELVPGGEARLEINGQLLDTTVVGVIKEFGPPSLYIRDANYRARLNDSDERVNAGFVRLKEPTEQNLAALTALLEAHFALSEVRIRGLQSGKIASRIIRGHLDGIVATLLVLALLVLSVSSLGMTSAVSTNVVERSRELAILRSIGGTPAAIRRILSSEAITVAILAWTCALLLSAVISVPVSNFFGEALVEYPFDFRFSPLGVAMSFGIAVVLAVLASIAPARLVNRQSVSSTIQNGS
jgi:ABC-type antimicrobial peptide transport system permease subunit